MIWQCVSVFRSGLGAAALALAIFAPGAGAGSQAGSAPLTVVKTVSGAVPAGTTFTATIQCDGDMIFTGGESTDVATVTFDATGQPTSADVIGFEGPGECEISETAQGGAATVSYACEGVQGTPVDDEPPLEPLGFDVSPSAVVLPPVCATVGANGVEVNISAPDQSGTVTITNTFVPLQPLQPIQPAAQVVAQPAFTG
jgi:hypothetical protein